MKLTAVIPALVLAAAATTATAQTAPETDVADDTAIEFVDPTISFAEAVAIANEKGDGDIQSMELDYPTDTPAYVVEMYGDLTQTDLIIDGLTGEVLMSNVLTFANEEFFEAMMIAEGEAICGIDDFDLDDLGELGDLGLQIGDEVPAELAELGLEPGDEVPAELIDQLFEGAGHDFCDDEE